MNDKNIESNRKWDEACSISGLKAGWHMATHDLKNDFIQVPFEKEQYAYRLEENLEELGKKLKSGEFVHFPTLNVPVPKGVLGTRPGQYIPLESRIVLFSIIRLIAEGIDERLKNSVYSYRVASNRSRDKMFAQSSIANPPFLKKATVDSDVAPFEVWYESWLKFSQVFPTELKEQGYRYMAKSDISAYFENIHLELLRDLLQKHIHDEQKIINFIITAFSSWTPKSPSGQQLMRGIPQGSDVSRFFGNCFLMPVDEVMSEMEGIKYYRYMDDIQIFSKDIADARSAILKFDAENRKLHLNLQSAKTKILDDNNREVQNDINDNRIGKYEEVKVKIKNSLRFDSPRGQDKSALVKELDKIMRLKPSYSKMGEGAIISPGKYKPLTGLTERLFRRVISSYIDLKSRNFFSRFIMELKLTQDSRMYAKLISVSRNFPNSKILVSRLSPMLDNVSGDVRDYQKGQILRAFRYQSKLTDDTLTTCIDLAENPLATSFLRTEALLLVARLPLNGQVFKKVTNIYEQGSDACVRRAAILVLVRQRGNDLDNFLEGLRGHANSDLKAFGDYLLALSSEEKQIKQIEGRLFDLTKHPYLLADYYPLVQMMLEKVTPTKKAELFDRIRKEKIHKYHPIIGIRSLLDNELKRYETSLR